MPDFWRDVVNAAQTFVADGFLPGTIPSGEGIVATLTRQTRAQDRCKYTSVIYKATLAATP